MTQASRVLASLLMGLLVLASLVQASPPPRIGLVLGGGGARGFAHLGILAELERLRIPVACMAGTSAGALVGGFYAAGLSPDTIQQAFDRTDWDRVLSGQMERADLPFRRKRDDYRNYFDLLTGFRDGSLRFPRAAVSSQHIDQLLHQITGDVVVDSFEHLPIPFQAIATDLLTGDTYVFDHGDLAFAQRASMAVPGLFEPVELDQRLLVDGGMARQLPVENLKRPGGCADVVIAIDVGSPSLKHEDIRSFVDVLAQYTQIGVLQNVRQQEKLLDLQHDILIRPELGRYTAANFKDHRALAELGREAVQAHLAALSRYSVSEAEYAAWQAQRQARRTAPAVVDRVAIAPTEIISAASLAEQLQVPLGPLDSAALQQQLTQVYASGDFERVGYRLARDGSSTVLEMTPLERAVAPNYLRMGLGLNSGTDGQNAFSLLFSHQRIWLNNWGAEWRNELAFGHSPGWHSEFYQPLGPASRWFTAWSLQSQEHPLRLYLPGGEQLGSYSVRRQAIQAELGLSLANHGEIRLGVFRGSERAQREVGDPAQFDSGREKVAGVQGHVVIDQFDRPKLPRNGYLLQADFSRAFTLLGSKQDFTHVRARLDLAHTLDANTLRATLKYARTFARSERIAADQIGLGGFLNLSGMGPNQLLGQETLLLRLMGYRQIAALPNAIGGGMYAGMSLEAGRVRHAAPGLYARQGWIPAASAYVVADSLLGPLFVGVGKAVGSSVMGYLFLGADF